MNKQQTIVAVLKQEEFSANGLIATDHHETIYTVEFQGGATFLRHTEALGFEIVSKAVCDCTPMTAWLYEALMAQETEPVTVVPYIV